MSIHQLGAFAGLSETGTINDRKNENNKRLGQEGFLKSVGLYLLLRRVQGINILKLDFT